MMHSSNTPEIVLLQGVARWAVRWDAVAQWG